MTSKYMSFSPQLVNERNAALNNCPTKSGRSQLYKNYYIKMKDAYKKYEEAIEDDEEDYEEDDDDDEDYEPSEDEEYEEEYEESECETEDEADQDEEESACETEDEEYEASACECEQEVPDQDANACETEADQEYCCCCEAVYACETEEASEAEAYACETEEEAASEAADEVEAGACETEAEENEFGCPGCNYEWRDGYKNGWRDAMKYIAGRTHKEVPDTPACSYCDIVCKTRKCGGKCGGVVRYCSVDCQKQDWAFGHKNICCK
jgi:hypothetical protein